MIPFKFTKTSNVSVGTQTINAPGSANMPGAGYSQSVSAGAADIPGKSVHCLSCGCKLKGDETSCVKCGADVRRVARASQGTNESVTEEASSSGDTGSEAATVDSSKTANALKHVMGGAVMVGGAYGAAKLAPTFIQGAKEQRRARALQLVSEGKLPESELQKFARQGANPILNIRRALKKLRNVSSNLVSSKK